MTVKTLPPLHLISAKFLSTGRKGLGWVEIETSLGPDRNQVDRY